MEGSAVQSNLFPLKSCIFLSTILLSYLSQRQLLYKCGYLPSMLTLKHTQEIHRSLKNKGQIKEGV
jgi:hypothetical protein